MARLAQYTQQRSPTGGGSHLLPAGHGQQGGQMLQQAGAQVQNLSGPLLERAQVIQAREKKRKLLQAKSRIMEMEQEFLPALCDRRGAEAVGAADEAQEFYRKSWEEVQADIHDEDVRLELDNWFSGRAHSSLRMASKHALDQGRVAIESQTKAYMSDLYSEVETFAENEPRVLGAIEEAERAIRDASPGLDVGHIVDEHRNKMLSAAVTVMIERSPDQAKVMIDKWEKENRLDEVPAGKLRDALKTELENTQASDRYAELRDAHGANWEAIAEQIDQVDDLGLKKKLQAAYNADRTMAKQLETEAEQDRLDEIAKGWFKRGLDKVSSQEILDADIPWEAQEHFLAAQGKGGGKADPATYLQVRQMIADGEITRTNQLAQYLPKLGDKYASLADKVVAAHGQDGKGGDSEGNFKSYTELGNLMEALKVPDETRVDIIQDWDLQVRIEEEKRGGPLSQSQRLQMGRELVQQFRDSGRIFKHYDRQSPALERELQLVVQTKKVHQGIRDHLIAAGIPNPTDEDIKDVWLAEENEDLREMYRGMLIPPDREIGPVVEEVE